MLNVETIRKVRQAHHRDSKGIREIARLLNLSRNTVRSIIRSGIIDQKYERSEQPRPKLGSFVERLSEWLKEDGDKPVKHRRRAQILFEQLQREGYDGGYDAVRRYVGTWKVKVAQFRLCNSRKPCCVAYTRESLEMVLDAHIRAFEFFGGLCRLQRFMQARDLRQHEDSRGQGADG